MALVSLYNSLYRLLSSDQIILNYLQIDPAVITDPDELALLKANRVQRRQKPVDTVSNLPVISFYNAPGRREGHNDSVYHAPFIFDVYTQDDVQRALDIHERIFKLLDGEIPDAGSQLTMETRFLDGFESPADLLNTYCYTQVFELVVSLDKEDR